MALVHVFLRAPLKYSPAAVRGAAGSHQGAGSERVLMCVLSNIDSVSGAAARDSDVDGAKVSLKVLSHSCCADSPTETGQRVRRGAASRLLHPWPTFHPHILSPYRVTS